MERSKDEYYEGSRIPPSFQLQRPEESMHKMFKDGGVTWDTSIVDDLMDGQDLQLLYTQAYEKVGIMALLNGMNRLCVEDHLLLEYVPSRNTMYSGGRNFKSHVRETLSKMDCFKDLFASIEAGGYDIGNIYNGAYGEDFGNGAGRIDLHQDADYKECTHRLISPFGCIDKELWFKKGEKVCGLRTHHGAVVCMSRRAGGVTGDVYHAASRCGKSWILVIEVSKKK